MLSESKDLTAEDLEQDCRRERRIIWFKPLEILPCDTLGEWEFQPAKLTDVSPSGIGLISSRPMIAGEQFFARVAGVAQNSLLLYEVRHCTGTVDAQHRVGAQFMDVVASRYQADRDAILNAILQD